ncbi:MAG: GNAT family N-acetyltransferase, partial [bacterium]|nr:GNAT family N-acetyltransferase [bacterium]
MSDKFWTIRNYLPADFENYIQLQHETEKQDQSGYPVSRQFLAEALGHPGFHPETDLFLAAEDQNLIGCVSVFLEPGIGRALLEGMVHPLHRKKGIATDLFENAIRHVGDAGIKVAQICIPETNRAAKKMLTGLGLRYFRHFIGHKLDLTTTQLPDIKMDKYIFRKLQPGEAAELTSIQNRSFGDTW